MQQLWGAMHTQLPRDPTGKCKLHAQGVQKEAGQSAARCVPLQRLHVPDTSTHLRGKCALVYACQTHACHHGWRSRLQTYLNLFKQG